jgi:spore coat protein CotH
MRLEASGSEPAERTGKIHLRGAASKNYAKKSYAMELDRAIDPLGMTYGKHWILNAAFIDRSLMRHKLSYDLFLSMSTEKARRHAAESRFVEVYLNKDYQGVYLLMEQVDGQMTGLLESLPNEPRRACMYKAINHDANFAKAGHSGFEQKEPDPEAMAYWKPLDELHEFILTATEERFREEIGRKVDLENAIDFHLLVLATGNLDGITKNYYLCRELPLGDAETKFFFVPWDYDGTFGRNWNATKTATDFWLSNNLFDKLMADPAYKKRFVERWRELREKEFSVKTVCGMIDENVRTMGKAPERNAARWASQAGIYPDALTFAQDAAEMKQWVEKRFAWLDKRILGER